MSKVLITRPEVCTGCRLCESICSFHHEQMVNPTLSRIKIIKDELKGIDVPVVCSQCQSAPCINICPVGALSKDKVTSAVSLNDTICIGCKQCAAVCPFGAISLNPTSKKLFMCDLCNGNPQCVKYCTTKAVDYVDPHEVSGIDKRRSFKESKKKLEEYYSRTGGLAHPLGPEEY
jgi:carbon-monoxide dehydrogenase iron sulfur subunit